MSDNQPSTDIINLNTRMEPGFSYFICYICDLIPPPDPKPKQCAECHSLFCDECTKLT